MLQAKSAAGREHQDEDAGSPSRFKYKLTQVRCVKVNPRSTEWVGKGKTTGDKDSTSGSAAHAWQFWTNCFNSLDFLPCLALKWIYCSGFHGATAITDISDFYITSLLQPMVLSMIGKTERHNLHLKKITFKVWQIQSYCVIHCNLDEQISVFNRNDWKDINACHIKLVASWNNTYPKYFNNSLLRSSGIYSDINPCAYRT